LGKNREEGKMTKPIDFLIENQNVISEVYYRNESSPGKSWDVLQDRLPKLSESMRISTFKQYLSVFIALRENLKTQDEDQLSKLRQALLEKENKVSALRSRLRSMEAELSDLKQKKRNIDGWTVRLTAKGYYNLCKSFGGKVESIYVGKILDEDKAREKIAERISKLRQKGVIQKV
jgi:predicted nuclease with TOPRIM domain